MSPNLVLRAVRSSNRLILVLSLICFLIVATGIFFDQRQLLSFMSGPRDMTNTELLRTADADALAQYWVNLKGSTAIDTGWQEYTSTDNGPETVTSGYAALPVGKHYLLVRIPHEITDQDLKLAYTGALINIPVDVSSQVISGIQSQLPNTAPLFLPVMLDTSDFRTGAYIAIALIALGILIALALLYVAVRRTLNPNRHPIMKALARYGDPLIVSENITQEMAASPTRIAEDIQITRHWFVFNSGTNFQAARLQDVVWLYKNVTRHRTYGIQTRKTFSGYVWDQQGKLTAFPGKEAAVDAGLQAVAQAAPWAVWGYTAETNTAWKKKRAEFLASVNQRRRDQT